MTTRTLSVLLTTLTLAACGGEQPKNSDEDQGGLHAEGTQAGDCNDGADNDDNGAFDCEDEGCAGSPACEDASGASSSSGSTSGGSTSGGPDGGCEVVVAGQYYVDLYAHPNDECETQLGWGLNATVEQDGCSVTTTVSTEAGTAALPGTLAPRGPDAWGYNGTTYINGYPVTYDVEFSGCASTCGYATSTIVAGPLNCHYEGSNEN